jgi:hypothetical protein
MRKIMFLAIAMMLFIGSAMAQDQQQRGNRGPMNPEQRLKMRMERLSQLNLTDEQKAKVEVLYKDQDAQMSKLREQQSGGDREAMRANFEKMRTEQDAKMKAILTPEQYAKFTEMNKNMGPRGGMGPRGAEQKSQGDVKEKAAEVKVDATQAATATDKAAAKAAKKAAAKKAKEEAKLKKAAEEAK